MVAEPATDATLVVTVQATDATIAVTVQAGELVRATVCSTVVSEAYSVACDAMADATAAVQQLLIADAMQLQLVVANQLQLSTSVHLNESQRRICTPELR